MNRVKLWVFTLLVVAAGFYMAHAGSTARRADAVAALDARLAGAAAHLGAATHAAGREAAAAAALVARDEHLLAALRAPAAPAAPPPSPKGKKAPPPPPPPAPDPAAQDAAAQAAAKAALERAEKALGFDLPQGTQVLAASQATLAGKTDESDVSGLLRGAAGGQARRAVVRQAGGLFAAAARPAGEGGVLVLLPLDEAWAKRLATAAGVDVTLAVPEVKPVSTARGVDPALLLGATRLAGAGDVGRPVDVELTLGPVTLPKLPQPIAGGAPVRARAVPLEGVKGGYVVASIAAAATVNPAATFLWWSLFALAGVLLVGLVLGLFVRSTEPTPQVPEALLAAAARIEKGDFSARAPALAGKFGTVAEALNRAAEIAGPAMASKGAPAAPTTTEEWFQAGAAGGGRGLGEPARAPTLVTTPAAARAATATAVPAPVPEAAAEPDEETEWQQVFEDFLRTRASCGENAEGLTYERFRQKLEANKAQLVAKYGCKTVRFQVYVKDGKTALKATPVK